MENNDRVIEHFNQERMRATARFPLICIYKHPIDYPDKYVARLWDINKPTNIIVLADTIEELRGAIPKGMVRINRNEKDDPCIVEVWI